MGTLQERFHCRSCKYYSYISLDGGTKSIIIDYLTRVPTLVLSKKPSQPLFMYGRLATRYR